MLTRIKGVHINVTHFKEHKSLKSLKADERKIFEHLSIDEQESAHQELYGIISTMGKGEKKTIPIDLSEAQ